MNPSENGSERPAHLGFVVKSFGPEHLEEALELEKACFSDPWGIESLKMLLRQDVSVSFACEDQEGHLISYGGAICVAGEGEIINLATRPDMRRLGCASAVLDTILSTLASLDTQYVFLEVRRSNTAAISLYSSKGFVPAGIRKKYYTTPTEDALIMKKSFTEESE